MKKIEREELKQKMDVGDDFVLVEALSPESYEAWHLPGAINVPKNKVSEEAEKLIPNKDTVVITYCSSPTCTASTVAAEAFDNLGYTNVYEYEGGKSDWQDAGYPKES